jgi:hypothetical protein
MYFPRISIVFLLLCVIAGTEFIADDLKMYFVWQLILVLLVQSRDFAGIGDRLLNNLYMWTPLPLNITSAQQEGWTAVDQCNKYLGIPYEHSSRPYRVYYTSFGQVAGNYNTF